MKVYCPYCCKEVEYKVEKRSVENFKNIKVDTFENVAICNECNSDLYVDEIENENNKRIYDIYRNKTNIINAQDIVELREKYNLSQRELTSILGFGKMTINRYERGKLPTKAQSDYIKFLIENEDKFILKAKEAYENNVITLKTYKKVANFESKLKITKEDIRKMLREEINLSLERKPDIYNGYKNFDLDKVENIISYIASKVKNLTITSLNKYLWFIDTVYFKNQSISITGLTYQHEKFGPTIVDKKYNDITFIEDKYKKEYFENEIGTTTKIVSNNNYDLSKLEKEEINTIDSVIKLLKNKTVAEISEMSHNEEGWKKTKRYEKISFEYAMSIHI